MVVPGGVKDEVAQYFSGGGVDHCDVVVLGEDQDAGSVVDAADADVVEASVNAQGDGSGFADAVGADAVVGVDAGCWVGFGPAGVNGGRGGVVGQGSVWAAVVVFVDEGVELGLDVAECGGFGLLLEPAFEGLVEAFDFPTGGGVVGGGVDLADSEVAEFGFEFVASAAAAGESGGEDHAVVGEGGVRDAMGCGGFGEFG